MLWHKRQTLNRSILHQTASKKLDGVDGQMLSYPFCAMRMRHCWHGLILAVNKVSAKKEVAEWFSMYRCAGGWFKELAGYWRELLFWMLLLPALGALGSIRPRRQIAGLIEACAFLVVAVSSAGKLKSLGLEFVAWNRVGRRGVVGSLAMGLFAGCCIVVVAGVSGQPLGTENGWNKIVLAVALGPVLEEVIFRGYLLTAGILLIGRLCPSRSPASSIVAVAVVFSMAHLTTPGTTFIQLGCIVLTGCLYGFIRFRYRSTAAAALAHSAYNLALYISYWCGISR